jgi:lambda family phage portal protein
MFVKNKVRRFASGFGCSYETLSRDFSDTNYSSSRLSLLEDREHWRVIQNYLIENFHMRIFREWLGLAVLSGELPFADYEGRPERYETPRWMARGWSWVDPLKEVKAYREAEQAGYMTKAQIIAYTGGDYDDNVTELAREQELAQSTGVTLDKDILDAAPSAPDVAPEPEAAPPARAKSPSRRKKA